MGDKTKLGHTVVINGGEYIVQVGSLIQPERWQSPSRLEVSEWDQADFRIPSQSYMGVSVAVNVRFTGRTFQRRPYSEHLWIKVEIEFVGDGEPGTHCAGWVVAERGQS